MRHDGPPTRRAAPAPASAARRRLPRLLLLLALATAVAGLPGCTLFTMFSQLFPPKEPAVYKLPDAPTLVLVEDPSDTFPDPALPGVIASRVVHDLRTEAEIQNVISLDKLHDYKVEKGETFAKLPLDQIGRDLGAEQVISVVVESAGLNMQPGVYRPAMVVRVKVINAKKSERMFPALGEATLVDPSIETRGYPVRDQMFYRIASETGRSEAAVVMRRLAERMGRNVGWLFYKHVARQPGDRFEE